MKTIVQFIDKLTAGGKERQCVELVKFLSARGDYLVHVVCMTPDSFFPGLESIPRVNVYYLPRRSKNDPTVFWRFLVLCRRLKPSVITAWHPMTAIYAIPAAWVLKIKLVSAIIQSAPSVMSSKLRRHTWLAFACSDSIVANSAAGIRAYNPPRYKTALIHAGYDLEKIGIAPDPTFLRREFDLRTHYIVGMVAAFSEFKDQPTFIAAAHIILRQRRDVTFVMIGGGPTLEACQALVAGEDADHIRCLGEIPTPIEDIIAAFDIGALITFTEGISNSIIEYMILRKPVVATDGGGTAELLLDGETGILVRQSDPASVAAAIMRLLDDAELRQRMGARGRHRIETEFLAQHTFARYAELYDFLLSGVRREPYSRSETK